MDGSLVKRDPEIMSGALCFPGTRVPVTNLVDYLEGSSSLEEFLEEFPSVSRVRAVAVLEPARAFGSRCVCCLTSASRHVCARHFKVAGKSLHILAFRHEDRGRQPAR